MRFTKMNGAGNDFILVENLHGELTQQQAAFYEAGELSVQAVVDLMESIALQETALSHILCAESRKMQKAMDLDGLDLCKLLEVNDSATNMVHAVANLELVLKDKLEFVSNNLYVPGDSGCPSPAQ